MGSTTDMMELDDEIDGLNNLLAISYIKYLKAQRACADFNKSELAREINTIYMKLAIMAVNKGLDELYQIPSDIVDLVRCGTITDQIIPQLVQPLNEPVVDMFIDDDMIEEALNRTTCQIV